MFMVVEAQRANQQPENSNKKVGNRTVNHCPLLLCYSEKHFISAVWFILAFPHQLKPLHTHRLTQHWFGALLVHYLQNASAQKQIFGINYAFHGRRVRIVPPSPLRS